MPVSQSWIIATRAGPRGSGLETKRREPTIRRRRSYLGRHPWELAPRCLRLLRPETRAPTPESRYVSRSEHLVVDLAHARDGALPGEMPDALEPPAAQV